MHSDLLLYVPGSLPGSTSHISSVNLHNHHVEEKYNYYPHFSGESSEAQRREVTWHSKARTRISLFYPLEALGMWFPEREALLWGKEISLATFVETNP